jgi:hypothetical protein
MRKKAFSIASKLHLPCFAGSVITVIKVYNSGGKKKEKERKSKKLTG